MQIKFRSAHNLCQLYLFQYNNAANSTDVITKWGM